MKGWQKLLLGAAVTAGTIVVGYYAYTSLTRTHDKRMRELELEEMLRKRQVDYSKPAVLSVLNTVTVRCMDSFEELAQVCSRLAKLHAPELDQIKSTIRRKSTCFSHRINSRLHRPKHGAERVLGKGERCGLILRGAGCT